MINQFRNDIDTSGLSGIMEMQNNSSHVPNKMISPDQVVSIINYMRGEKNVLTKIPPLTGPDPTLKNSINGTQIPSSEVVSLFNDVN